MRLVLFVCAVTALIGCGPANPCRTNQECEPTGYCDQELSVCVAKAVCDPACAAFAECSRGACKPRYSGITIVSPTAAVGARTPTEARLELVDGRSRQDPASLTWTLTTTATNESATGTLELVGEGVYRGHVVATVEGAHQLQVSYPEAGVASEALAVQSELSPPALTVSTGTPPRGANTTDLMVRDPVPGFGANAWRRDEKVTVAISSDSADFDGASIEVKVTGIGASGAGRVDSFAVGSATGCGTPYCVEVDLAKTEMLAMRGTMELVVTARDQVGNLVTRNVPLPVTRWKWAYTAGGAVKGTPAIGVAGTVYFGSDANTDNVVALKPDGTPIWKQSYGSVEGSVSLGVPNGGRERVYVGASTVADGATFYALDDQTGAVLKLGTTPTDAKCGPYPGGTVLGGAAVSETTADTTLETMHAVYNASGAGELISLRPGGNLATGKLCVPQTGVKDLPSGAGVTIFGNDAYFSDLEGNIRAYTFNAGGWDPKFTSATNYFTLGVALVPSAGKLLAGGRGAPGSGAILTVPLDGSSNATPLAGSVAALNPSIGTIASVPMAVLGMQDKSLVRLGLDLTNPQSVSTDGTLKGAAAIGQDGMVYYATDTGRLQVRSFADLALTWAASQFGAITTDTLGDASASVALDCARPDAGGDALAGRPGTLYVGSATKNTLYAFVVDARGLDPAAPWPKYQRDQRNSGNPASTITACP